MFGQTADFDPSALTREDLLLAKENRDAAAAMWFGVGAVLCLLLTLIPASFLTNFRTPSIILVGAGLAVSVAIFFTAGKRDERWYVVCSLINHAGIGLAALILLEVLELPMRPLHMALSGVPAVMILSGVCLIQTGTDPYARGRLVWTGVLAEAVLFCVFLGIFNGARTEFWLLGALSALICCACLCACLWVRRDVAERSVFQALAVLSFAVYLILAAAAAAALLLGASGKSGSRSRSRSKRGSRSSGGLFSGLRSPLRGSGTGRFGVRIPSSAVRFWLWHTPSGRYRAIDRMENLSPIQAEMLRRKARRRAFIVMIVVIAVVILISAAAVYFGRG